MDGYLSGPIVLLLMVVALMSGLLSVIREVQSMYRPASETKERVYWRYVRIAFILSAAMLWVNEHGKVIQLKGQLSSLSKPEFVIESQTQASYCSEQSTVTFLGVRITNHGADSAVLDYEVYYDSLTENHLKVNTVYIPGEGFKAQYPSGKWYEIPAAGILYNQNRVIPKGDSLVGKLPIEIPGDRCLEIKEESTKITVRVKDYQGQWATGYFIGNPNGSQDPQLMQGEPMPIQLQPPQPKPETP